MKAEALTLKDGMSSGRASPEALVTSSNGEALAGFWRNGGCWIADDCLAVWPGGLLRHSIWRRFCFWPDCQADSGAMEWIMHALAAQSRLALLRA